MGEGLGIPLLELKQVGPKHIIVHDRWEKAWEFHFWN
jgi:hypothetical protein